MVRQLRILVSQFRVLRTGTLSEIRPDNMYQPLWLNHALRLLFDFLFLALPGSFSSSPVHDLSYFLRQKIIQQLAMRMTV